MATEMGVIIYLAAKGGLWLDEQAGNDKRIYTAFATLLGVAISIWLVLIQLKRLQDK
ncbi:AtpZ/AtpI family protein [Robiginitalea sp.]|nr:AtpZ/AtpI family protein [Robiginitalea sp.]